MALQTVTQGKLEYFTAEGLSVPHCFTTRLGGVSQGYLSALNLGANRGDTQENVAENYRILACAVGFDPENTVLTRQTHSDIVRKVTKADHIGFDNHLYPECDALITNDPGTALVVFTADCTPILLWDSLSGAVGAVHAGWRGTAAGLCEKTARAMIEQFGCRPENIRAAIGPNIGQCCFETDADVPQALINFYGDAVKNHIRAVGEKFYVNLKEVNALSLNRAGITHIDISDQCTACNPNRFWSHRKVGGQRGSMAAVILCKEG